MKTITMLITGLVLGLAATEAHALCQEGATSSCTIQNGCPGIKECGPAGWMGCEPVAGNKSCTVCSGTGTQHCDATGTVTTACTRAEACNNCDDDADGQVDEGLVGCNGVTCGDTFETCGDGLDNDCDGSTDEGCATCTSGTATAFPFNFNSINELRQDTVQPSGPVYGRLSDYDWRILPSHRMSSFSLKFDQFALEQGFDNFTINGTSFTGSPALPFTTSTFNIFPGTSTFLGLSTDSSVQTTGVRTTNINVKCNNGGGKQFNQISLNQGVDGALLYTDDNAYAQFTLPLGREAFISLDHDFNTSGTVDFDMFVTWDSALFATGCNNAQVCGVSASSTGEVVHIPASFGGDRSVKVTINSWSGAGRYRLFVASPVVSFGNDVDLAFDANVTNGSTLDLRAKSEWARGQRQMMDATDGQYRIDELAYVTRDVSCFSCYDLVFSNDSNINSTACIPAQTAYGIGGWYVVLSRPFWAGESSWVEQGQPCTAPNSIDRVSETIVHEWGHYDFDLGDERDGIPRNQCGFSLMAGSGFANFTTGNHEFEFCGSGRHGANPQTGATGATGNDNWTDILSDYPEMSAPAGTGDFSRMNRLGEMMEARAFVSFTEN